MSLPEKIGSTAEKHYLEAVWNERPGVKILQRKHKPITSLFYDITINFYAVAARVTGSDGTSWEEWALSDKVSSADCKRQCKGVERGSNHDLMVFEC